MTVQRLKPGLRPQPLSRKRLLPLTLLVFGRPIGVQFLLDIERVPVYYQAIFRQIVPQGFGFLIEIRQIAFNFGKMFPALQIFQDLGTFYGTQPCAGKFLGLGIQKYLTDRQDYDIFQMLGGTLRGRIKMADGFHGVTPEFQPDGISA